MCSGAHFTFSSDAVEKEKTNGGDGAIFFHGNFNYYFAELSRLFRKSRIMQNRKKNKKKIYRYTLKIEKLKKFVEKYFQMKKIGVI